jgi:hypothetical protein
MTVAERWINGEQGGELRFEAVEEVLCVGEAELGLEQLIARTSSVRPTCGVDRGVQCRQRATVHRSPTHTTEPAGRGASAAHLCPNCPHASAPPLVSTHARSRVGPYASAPTRQPSLVSPSAPDQRVCPRASVVPSQPFLVQRLVERVSRCTRCPDPVLRAASGPSTNPVNSSPTPQAGARCAR